MGKAEAVVTTRGVRLISLAILPLVMLLSAADAAWPDLDATSARESSVYGQLPLNFVANRGQTDPRAAFVAHGKGYTLFLSPTETVFVAQAPPRPAVSAGLRALSARSAREVPRAEVIRTSVVRMQLLGADPSSVMTGHEQTSTVNYLFGDDRSKWLTGVPAYARVRAQGIYPGVDLVFYGNRRQFEYDFVVHPGTDPQSIRLGFEGLADDKGGAVRIDARGDLVLRTAHGDLRLHRPIAYQEIEGTRRLIEARYVVRTAIEHSSAARPAIGIDVVGYDAGRPLVIDPVLDYSTYLGGSGNDAGMAIAVDAAGQAYVTGLTESPDFPVAGVAPSGGTRKVFVAKLNATGSALLYATYLGGNGNDTATGIAVDATGNAYVTGLTESTDFPTVRGYQSNQGGTDAFVTKLDPSGATPLYSTYLGGSGVDVGLGIAVDGGQIYVTGYMESSDFPRRNAFQKPGGGADAFVTKLNPDLSGSASVVYSTPLGGTDRDEGHAIAVDSQGHAYVAGFTDSAKYPTQNAYKKNQPGRDAFVTKLAPAGNALVFSTYLGGSGTDVGLGIAVDAAGMVYVTGYTDSSDFPKKTPYQSAAGGGTDAFATKFDAAGGLASSTYLGGSGGDAGLGIAVSANNDVHVTGHTDSTNFPTLNSQQGDQGGRDAFVVKLQLGSGSALVYSTYVGGGGSDEAYGIALDAEGNAYITGVTQSADFPTAGAFATTLGGSQDAFVAKLIEPVSGADLTVSSLSVATGAGASITVTETTKNAGNLAVAATTTKFYLSTDSTFDAGDVLLGSRAVPALEGAATTSTASTTLTIPSSVSLGSYLIIARADADEVISELEEDNNTSSTAFTVGPDLVVSTVTAPAQGGAEASITVTDTTANQGPRPSTASSTKFYLSSDATLDASDVLLGSRAVPALAPGTASSGSTTIAVPASTPPGTYVVIAKADADGTNAESNEANNSAASAAMNLGPDLVVSALLAPATGGPGSSIAVGNTIKNQGGGPAGASTVKFYLSTDGTFDAGDVLLGSRAVPALAAGAISVESTSLTVPAGTAIGTYVVIARADADGAVAEANEDNNTATSSSVAMGADLVVSSVSAPGTAAPGATVTVQDVTLNQSSASVGPTTTRFYLSSDTILDGADALVGSRPVPALGPGASSSGATGVTIPATAGGQFFVIAKANADGAVAETDTSNNTASSGLVKVGADLVISIGSAPATAGPGAAISVTDTTRNLGAAAAGASTTRFYLSADAVLDASDVALGTRAVPALAASGGVSTGSTSLTIPTTIAAGNYFIIARADADGAVVEMDEANNTASRAIAIGADLSVSQVSAPPHAGSGLTIAVTDTTQNESEGAASASTTSFYLSSDAALDASDVLLGSRAVPALAGSASSTATTTLTISAGTPPGRYHVIAQADSAGAIAEISEGNNTRASGEIKIGPDLAMDALTAPVSASPGGTIPVTDTVINYGGGAAGPFVVKFFFSTDDVLDAGDVYVGSRAVAGVEPGPPWQTSAGSADLALPTGLAGGTYYIIGQADAEGVVAEQDETNNIRARAILIGGDIVVWLDLPGASIFGAPGSPLSVTDTTRNQGGVAVGASTTAFYLSSDATLDASDTPLGSRAIPPLGPGESSTASNSLTIPLGVAGDYYIIARANDDGAIPEQSGENNVAVTNRTVRIGADLVVFLDAPGAASPGEEGSPLAVTDTTRNDGALASGASTTTFYLSADATIDPSDVLLGSRAAPALAPGEASTVTTTFTVPAWLSGIYRVIAQSDADHTVTGLVLKGSEVQVAIDAPVPPGGSAPTVVVTDSTKNDGASPVSASTTSVYLSLDGTLDGGDIALGSRAVPALAPGDTSTTSTTFAIPAGIAGTYKVIAQSDLGNSVTSVVVESANLLVAAEGSGVSSAPGSTITVTDLTKNEATVAVPTSSTAFYLSSDQVLDASDTFLASRAVPALAAGETSTASTSLTLPASAFGALYIIARADSQDAVPEYDKTNNTAATPVLIGADLIVRSVSGPSKAGAGMPIQVTDVTVNLSAAPAGPTTTRFYLSANGTLDEGDVLLGTRSVPALTGASSSATTTFTIPAATATGKYYILAVADVDNSVTEADESNNLTASASMKIGPDLAVDALGAPVGAGAGQTITVTDTIVNYSPATAGPSTLKFYFSTDGTLDASDTLMGSRNVPSIAGGFPYPTHAGSTSVTIPASLAGGTYYIIAKADADEVVAEIHEDNNVRSRAIQIGPDMVVTLDLAGSSASAAPGGTITVTDFTKNDSASPAGPTVTRFYLSTNSVLEPSDVAIGSRSIPALDAGATSSATNTLTLPAGIGGVYYVIAKADADNSVAETNEDNNAIATAGTVRVGPDLVAWLDVPAASSTPAAGATISVTDFTRNDSSSPVGATTTKIYLSTDATFDVGDTLVATRAVPALAPGEVNSGVSTFALPVGQTGTRYLIAKADADEAVFEANENNNTSAAKSINIGPDLIVWIDVPGGVANSAAGATVTVSDWTRSDNSAPAGASTTKFYLVTGTTVDASAVLLGSRAIPALGPSTTNTGSTTLTLPATASGTYRIIAKADADNAVAEGNEDNNVSAPSTPFTIGPDLVAWLDVPAASSTPATGATIAVTDFARNDAATAAPASTTKLYYSTSAAFDASAAVVGSRAIPALGPGEVNSGTIAFTLPAGHVGTRYLFARADADNAVVEANENNNTSAAKSINIGPDLIVWIDVPGGVASSAAGATVTVSDWTRSDNSAPAGASTTKFYLVTGTTVDAGAVLLGSRVVPALGPSTTNTGSTTLTLLATASGTYRIIAKADADNAVAEANEDNNVSAPSTPFTIGPDLVAWLDVPAASSNPATGATIAVTDFARNDAATAAPASMTRLYYSTSATFDASAVVVGSRAIPALAPGQVNSGTITFTVPAGHTGTRYLFARADADGAVVESNEANNVSVGAAITIGGDFIVWIDVPGSVTNGMVTVNDWTRSDNAAPVGASTTRFYLITGTTLDGSAIPLGGRAVPALGPSTTNAGATTLTLPATAAGTYRIIAKADGDDVVVEANENNNLSAASAPFTLGPDLRVFLDVPGAYAQVAAGSTLSITDVTRNDGAGGAGASSTWFYLSADTTLDAGDVPLGSRAIPALAGGASSTGSTPLTLPGGIAGTYYIIAVADAAGTATETNEANNVTVSTPIEVGPDLTIPGTTVPVKAAAGATVHISDVTKNRGGAPAPTTTTRIYLSADAALDAGDVLLGSRTIPALSAGIYNADTTAVVIPTTTPAGSYFIIVAGDAGAIVAESNEANNTLAKPIDILPDVRVTVLTAPSKAFPGSTITVGDTTVNQGAAAGPATTAFFLSTDAALDAGDLPLGSRAVPALGLGESNTGSIQVAIPAELPGGTYTIIAVGDAGGAITELDETNNTRIKTLTVGPDLTVSTLSVPSAAAVGATIIVTDTTRNQGSAAAASTTRFYLSLGTAKAAGDPEIGSRTVPALSLNGSSTSSTMLTIPAGTAPGNYYVIAECDAGNAVAELTETNNTKSRAITITP